MQKKSHSMMMRESKQKCGSFTVIAGNLEGLQFLQLFQRILVSFALLDL